MRVHWPWGKGSGRTNFDELAWRSEADGNQKRKRALDWLPRGSGDLRWGDFWKAMWRLEGDWS
jgi:hypothetical protein